MFLVYISHIMKYVKTRSLEKKHILPDKSHMVQFILRKDW